MTRIFTIMIFALGVLNAAGFSLPRSNHERCGDLCGLHTKQIIEVENSCCSLGDTSPTVQDDYCSMSGGPCQCGARPVEDRGPHEPMPMPQRDRDTLQMVRAPPPSIRVIDLITPQRLCAVSINDAYRSGNTHNRTQAILGVWRR